MANERSSAQSRSEQATDTLRLLVVANETVEGRALLEEIAPGA